MSANGSHGRPEVPSAILGRYVHMPAPLIEVCEVRSDAELCAFQRLMRAIFPGEEDAWSVPALAARRERGAHGRNSGMNPRPIRVEYMLIRVDGELAGVRWLCIDRERRAAYCPYGGLLPAYRRRALYAELLHKDEARLRAQHSVAVLLNDCTDPAAHPGDAEAVARIRFFQRHGYAFVCDAAHPYTRPAPNESSAEIVSEGYLLGFKRIDPEPVSLPGSEGSGVQSISVQEYRFLYLCLMRLDTGITDEPLLIARHPAIAQFLARVDRDLAREPELRAPLLAAL